MTAVPMAIKNDNFRIFSQNYIGIDNACQPHALGLSTRVDPTYAKIDTMLKLKNLELKSNIVQSPMAGCTDLAYRLISRAYGMEFCFLEMVSAESLVRGNGGAEELMKTVPEDKPLGAQLVGCRPEAMGEAATIIEGLGYDLLDLKFGCPVNKIAGQGAGSALLGEPEKTKEIFKAVMKSIKKIPVTVKMRLGVQDASGDE